MLDVWAREAALGVGVLAVGVRVVVVRFMVVDVYGLGRVTSRR